MMDAKSKEMLDEILAKEPAAMTDADKGFLRARRSYLNEEQKAVYAEVLADHPEAEETASEESETEQPKARKSSKA
jgi:hypothetical protein